MIVSKAAGAGAGHTLEPRLRAELSAAFDLQFHYPSSVDELTRTARALAPGARRLAVAGGDGTLHHVINAVAGAPLLLAPIPIGSGNDFCRGVGLTTSAEVAARALAGGRTQRVDLVEVNGVLVCTVAGLGLVADTGVQVGRLLAPGSPWRTPGRALGDLSYLAGAAARLLFHPRVAGAAHVTWRDTDGTWHEAHRRLHGIMFANLQTLGAGLRLPLPVTADDGAFELVQVLEGSRVKLARSLSCLRSNRPVPAGTLEVAHVVEARIDWEGGSRLLGDGEDLGAATVFSARVRPAALEVPRLHPEP